MDMQEILAAFTSEPFFSASEKFLKYLGVKTSTQTAEPIPFLEMYEDAAKDAGAEVPKPIKKLFGRVVETFFIGSVDDDTLHGGKEGVSFQVECQNQKYKGMFVFAVRMKAGEELTRTDAALLTRGINRLVHQQPAIVLILEGTLLSVATCERTPYKQTWRPGEKLGKVSILKGVNCPNPHRGHIDILESMSVKDSKTFDALYSHWKDVFSAKLLTEAFYREIQNWYFWALKADQHVSFPNALDDDADDEKFNKENLIRLITRLVFTWFMKAKGLVNEDLFDSKFLAGALKYFDPEGTMDDPESKDADKHCTYYRAVLQNLFFATFNQAITDRGFVDTQILDAKRYNIKNYFRNAQLFTETDKDKIIAYFDDSPMVNGGLFECLDNVEQFDKESGKTRVYSWDGFSNNVRFKDGSLKSALIPDRLFFGAERAVDLSEFFEKSKASKAVKVRGIINILNDYVFTIEENTPLDEDVALDPELLGKVFENLLGCYNPETQQMARNATGSFYTPREIVNYMVHVSLAAYLKRTCPKVVPVEIDALVEGRAELDMLPSVKDNAQAILTSLFKAKILDPACGSGAFPMGTLAVIVEILRTIDPNNKHWFKIVLEESLKEVESVADVGDEKEREELKGQIEYDFQKRVDFPDYARKLYVIEHCIFGSDIQPIAVQISRLRFFITLLCEQAKTDDPAKNYGITPLPNLENNFVAANSLLSIDIGDIRELLGQKKIVSLVRQLRAKRHQLFLPKTSDKKKRLQKEDENLRTQIATAAESLYDENVAEKLKLLESEIVRVDAALKKLTPDDFKDAVREIEEKNLFGEVTVMRKKVIGTGNALTKRRESLEDEIATLKNSSRKERLLADLKRLVAWNPFAFNVAETFLDPEWMFGVKDGFDVVIGNPPYGVSIKGDYRNSVVETLGKCPDFEIYYYFIVLSQKILCKDGILSYIIPNTWLFNTFAKEFRRRVLSTWNVYEILDCTQFKIFESATVLNSIVLWSLHAGGDRVGFRSTARVNDFATLISRPLQYLGCDELLQMNQNWALAFKLDPAIVRTVNHISQNKALQFYFPEISQGLIAYDKYQGQDPSIIKSRAYHFSNYHAGLKKWLWGEDVNRYSVSWNGKEWIDYCSGIANPRNPKFFMGKRLLVREITNPSIYATITDDELYHDPAVIVVKDSESMPIECVVAILNSRLATFFHFNHSPKAAKGAFPKILVQDIKDFPVPEIGKLEQQKLVGIVGNILELKTNDSQSDTLALEAEIDSIVYKLYGLTDDEIAVVENALKK